MDELITEEEICKQLLELAQTPEQVRYLTSNNQAVLLNKMKEYESELIREDSKNKELRVTTKAKEEAYLKAIVGLAKGMYYNDDY